MLIERGDCDDQHYLGLDGAFIPWAKQLWDVILEKYPTTEPIISDNVLLPPSFRMEFIQDKGADYPDHITLPGEFDLTVKQNTRITATDHFQEVRHVELISESPDFKYEPGDIAVITPQNLIADVDLFFEQLGWTEHADKWIRFIPANEDHVLPAHWPQVMTFRDLFVYHLDVFGVPRRSFFEMLAYFTTDENHTERLREFASPEGQEDMWAYCARPRRHIGEILFDFKPFDIPFDYMLDLFPQLQPRSFSIASSFSVHPGAMELCVAVVKYKTKMRKIRRGVMTKWISTWQPGDVIPRVRIAKGTMELPPSADIPLITIGPGTGVAPMRSFLEERVVTEGAAQNVLLFGCRYHDKDFYYKEQWQNYQNNGQLTLLTAFSRDQDQKVYVQDRIRQHAGLLWDLIENQQAKVVLSGSLDKMPGEVAYAFKQIFMKEGKLTVEEAENYFFDMNKTGQYQEECWN
jgi:sulfite reductase alpha subunit-like flavoprotein